MPVPPFDPFTISLILGGLGGAGAGANVAGNILGSFEEEDDPLALSAIRNQQIIDSINAGTPVPQTPRGDEDEFGSTLRTVGGGLSGLGGLGGMFGGPPPPG